MKCRFLDKLHKKLEKNVLGPHIPLNFGLQLLDCVVASGLLATGIIKESFDLA
jgi:hypothetical protein